MQLFAFRAYEELAQQIVSQTVGRGQFRIDRFPNQELYAVVDTPVAGQNCVALGSIVPPDENLLSMLLLCHTLKKEGATHVTALLPYLAYARQDREEAGKSRGLAWIGDLLRASGVDAVVTVDVHSQAAHSLLSLPLRSLSPAALFAAEIARLSLREATLVAPDRGALERCQEVWKAAGMRSPIAYMEKKRTPEGIKHLACHGEVGPQAIVIDDILDTGGTLVSCCEILQQAGVQDIILMVTHGLFTGTHWQKLRSLPVRHIYCAATVPPPQIAQPVTSLSIGPLLQEWQVTCEPVRR